MFIQFWEVAPPPEIFAPAGAAIEAAIGGLIGWLGGILTPVRDAFIAVSKWIVALPFEAIHALYTYGNALGLSLVNLSQTLTTDVSILTNRIEAVSGVDLSTVNGAVAGVLQAAESYVDGIATAVWNDMRDLYNRSVSHADGVGQAVLGDAEDLYNRANSHADAVGQGVLAGAEALYNQSVAHADAVGQVATGVAEDLYNQAIAALVNADAAIDAHIAEVKTFAATAAGAAITAAVVEAMTAAEAAFGECCAFTTDQVKPFWDKVKGLLGKLTSRGPIVLVVLGAAAEYVAAFSKDQMVAAMRQAHKNDAGRSVAQLRHWAGRVA